MKWYFNCNFSIDRSNKKYPCLSFYVNRNKNRPRWRYGLTPLATPTPLPPLCDRSLAAFDHTVALLSSLECTNTHPSAVAFRHRLPPGSLWLSIQNNSRAPRHYCRSRTFVVLFALPCLVLPFYVLALLLCWSHLIPYWSRCSAFALIAFLFATELQTPAFTPCWPTTAQVSLASHSRLYPVVCYVTAWYCLHHLLFAHAGLLY